MVFKEKNINIKRIIEKSAFISIFGILIFLSNLYQNQYKVIFLFIIITATILLGRKFGVGTAIVSSFIILGIDFIFTPNAITNTYFQNDFIVIGVFILTARSLGHYVRIEDEKSKQKNIKREKSNGDSGKKDNQRKCMEEIILKNESCYNMLIENSRDAIFIHKYEKIVYANESALNLIGAISLEDVVGKSIIDFIAEEEKKKIKKRYKQVYDEKKTIGPFEEKITSKSGDTIYVESKSTYFIYEGQPTILSIIRDITPEKKVEELQKDVDKNIKLLNETLEFNGLITEFFANISHELKTPLNVIFSAAQLLNVMIKDPESKYGKEQKKYINMMKQNCYRLTRLINNLLDMTKLDSGFLKLNLEQHNIINVVENIVLSVVPYAESKGLNLVFDTNVEEKVMSFDADKMERIILNLLSNAFKFTDDGGVILVDIIDEEDNIKISVKDTGIGIPEDKLEVIFDRFRQVDKNLDRNKEGTGIGLSLVKSFVEMHEGTIEIKSTIGVGSEFIINIPAQEVQAELDEKHMLYSSNIERIHIEFSDIYFDEKSS